MRIEYKLQILYVIYRYIISLVNYVKMYADFKYKKIFFNQIYVLIM